MAGFDALDRLSSNDFAYWVSAMADLDTNSANERRAGMETRFFAALDLVEDAVAGLTPERRAGLGSGMDMYKRAQLGGNPPTD